MEIATPAAPAAAALEQHGYVQALKAHDWSHEFSDDSAVYQRGRAELGALREQQRRIDPSFSIWNQHCPAQCRDGRAYA